MDMPLNEVLASPLMRRRLTALVSRRVPVDATEDVVQSVLCDALAAPAVPEAELIPRWLLSIARHKVADWHRRARREPIPLDDEPVAGCASPEARDLLERVQTVAPDRRALDWILRSEEGEPLSDIARREKLPATMVRQRVSRLRRALRALLLTAAALAIALVVGRRRVASIGPEPVPGASLDGTWRVTSIECKPSAACVAAHSAHVRVAGNRAAIDLGATSIAVDIVAFEKEHALRIVPSGNVLRIESDLGSATLVRE